MTTRNKEKISPLGEKKPLHYPGQSLDDALDSLRFDIIGCYLASLVALFLAGNEWYRWYLKTPPQPAVFTIIAVLVLFYSIKKGQPLIRKRTALIQGRDGERLLGQYLEELRARGFHVLHDLNSGRGNVDHLLIGEKGVFTIETKTITKPRKHAEIHYDGRSLTVEGFPPTQEPILQARAESTWVKEKLKTLTGKDFPVKAVVIYLGWWVNGDQHNDVWVLNAKAFSKFLEKETAQIKADDVELAYAQLSNYVRTIDQASFPRS